MCYSLKKLENNILTYPIKKQYYLWVNIIYIEYTGTINQILQCINSCISMLMKKGKRMWKENALWFKMMQLINKKMLHKYWLYCWAHQQYSYFVQICNRHICER